MDRRTHLEFVDELKLIQPDLVVLGKFVNVDKKIKVSDKYGELMAVPYFLLKGVSPTIVTAIDKTRYWVNKAKAIHGDKYDYSNVVYENSSTKVCIICPVHGEFWQTPTSHLMRSGCMRCFHDSRRLSAEVIDGRKLSHVKKLKERNESQIKARLIKNYERFLRLGALKHDNKYDYSKVVYIDSKTRVCITCPKHGEFWQAPNNHLQGAGCRKCSDERTRIRKSYTRSEFIEKGLIEHDYKYDYSEMEYIDAQHKLRIICPIHGAFMQKGSKHLKGQGCPKCGSKGVGGYSRSDFIKKANGRECTLYKIHCWDFGEEFFKIGITCRSIEERFKNKDKMPYNYEVLEEIKGEAGEIFDLEKEEHRKCLEYRYEPMKKFGGSARECFHKLI